MFKSGERRAGGASNVNFFPNVENPGIRANFYAS
jgi:hypothetical protein